MMSPARITELLSQQTAVSPEDMRQLEQLAVRFPYFVPAQLLLACQRPNPASALQNLYLNPVMIAGHRPRVKVKQALPPFPEARPVEKQAVAENIIEQTDAVVTAESPVAENPDSKPAPAAMAEEMPDGTAATDLQELQAAHLQEAVDAAAEALETPALELPEVAPVYTEDYFRFEGIEVATHIPGEKELQNLENKEPEQDKDRSLMVMMSFTDWLMHYKKKSQAAKDEEADRQRLKSAWQREKLAAALQEEEDEIPEQVFEMAVNSLNQEAGLVSESLATILARQGKVEKAVEMYQKLSLKYPQKRAYFASQIETLLKNKDA